MPLAKTNGFREQSHKNSIKTAGRAIFTVDNKKPAISGRGFLLRAGGGESASAFQQAAQHPGVLFVDLHALRQ